MLRVHELEADKMMLQSERLVKQHELRRRELMLLRYDRQRQISDEIITRQRRIMEGKLFQNIKKIFKLIMQRVNLINLVDGRLALPPDLQDLYAMYQQEIHAATYADNSMADLTAAMEYVGKLPTISSKFTFDNLNNDIRTPSR